MRALEVTLSDDSAQVLSREEPLDLFWVAHKSVSEKRRTIEG